MAWIYVTNVSMPISNPEVETRDKFEEVEQAMVSIANQDDVCGCH